MESVLLGLCGDPMLDDTHCDWSVNKLGGKPVWMLDIVSSRPNCRLCGKQQTFVCQMYCPHSGSDYHRTIYVFACSYRLCLNKSESWTVLRQQLPSEKSRSHQISQKTEKINKSLAWGEGTDDWGNDDDDWGESTSNKGVSSEINNVDRSETNDSMEVKEALESDHTSADNETSEVDNFEQVDVSSTASNSKESPNAADTLKSQGGVENETLGIQALSIDAESNAVYSEEMSVHPSQSILLSIVRVGDALDADGSPSDSTNDLDLVSYYIDVVEEPACSDSLKHEKYLAAEYSKREGVDFDQLVDDCDKKSGKAVGGEKYEKALPKHGDRAFTKFMQRIRRCPEQVIRYCYNGQPVYLQSSSVEEFKSIPRCVCGSERLFEMQLMPAMINFLRTASQTSDFIEFGCVYIYTCSRSCWADQGCHLKEEFVIVHADTDQSFYRR